MITLHPIGKQMRFAPKTKFREVYAKTWVAQSRLVTINDWGHGRLVSEHGQPTEKTTPMVLNFLISSANDQLRDPSMPTYVVKCDDGLSHLVRQDELEDIDE